ncbi:MAG: trypsin-like peptidase domain-containing protein [Pyrinomonadaceae bacterium]|nr:trypsin-like peptidase domain-containing protein [Pyrinomonadaceae bacterium]
MKFSFRLKSIDIFYLTIVIGSLIVRTSAQEGKFSARQIAQRSLPSTVTIVMTGTGTDVTKLGSGFFVADDIVATNFHVISGTTRGSIKIYGREGSYRVLGTVGLDEKNDLALLKIGNVVGKALKLGADGSTVIGDQVYAVGNPEGLEGTFSQGIVSSIRKTPSKTLIQVTAPISEGSSGGPILNDLGEVVGIAVGSIEAGQALNFSIPVAYLRSLLLNQTPLVILRPGNRDLGSQVPKAINGFPKQSAPPSKSRDITQTGRFGTPDVERENLFGKVELVQETVYIPQEKFEKWENGEPVSTETVRYTPAGYVDFRDKTIYSDRDPYSTLALMWIQQMNSMEFPIKTRQLRFYDNDSRSLVIENYYKCTSCAQFELSNKFVTIYGNGSKSQFDPDGKIRWKRVQRLDSAGRTVNDEFDKTGELQLRTIEYENKGDKIIEEWRPEKLDNSKFVMQKKTTTTKERGFLKETTVCVAKSNFCTNEYRLRDAVTNLELRWEYGISNSNVTKYQYEFDAKKNWIKRTELEQVIKFGETYFESTKVITREINYY